MIFILTQLTLLFDSFVINQSNSLEGTLSLSSFLFKFEIFRLARIVFGLPILPIFDANKDPCFDESSEEARNDGMSFILEFEPEELSLSDDDKAHDDLS